LKTTTPKTLGELIAEQTLKGRVLTFGSVLAFPQHLVRVELSYRRNEQSELLTVARVVSEQELKGVVEKPDARLQLTVEHLIDELDQRSDGQKDGRALNGN
jgi:hypothetical protein